ncbi:MAG: hypothetical protein IPK75_19740 [Acidobacteria bacterium]|nr:hypothetical protein [Acidobacteriota bacterium]
MIYDVGAGNQQVSTLSLLRRSDYPAALTALRSVLDARLPGSVSDLVSLEAAIGELDNCALALAQPGNAEARNLVRAAMAARSADIADAITIAVNTSASASAARSALQAYESNAAVSQALEAGGQSAALERARQDPPTCPAEENQGLKPRSRPPSRRSATGFRQPRRSRGSITSVSGAL